MKKYVLPWVVALLLGGGMYAAQATQEWAGCKYLTGVAGVAITCPDTVGRGGATISGGGGGGVIGSGVTGGTAGSILFIDSAGKLAQANGTAYYDPTDPTGFAYIQSPGGAATSFTNIFLGVDYGSLDMASSDVIGHFIIQRDAVGQGQARVVVSSGANDEAEVRPNIGADGSNVAMHATNVTGNARVFLWPPLFGETATFDLMSWGASAGQVMRLQFFDLGNVKSVSLQAADAITPRTGNALELRLPAAAPAATNQALVGALDGDGVHVNLNFAAGITGTKTVRDSAGTGTCTLIFTGGVLTGGTC